MTKYRFTSAALAELKEATFHYERNEPGLGTSFLAKIDATVDRILRFPRAWHPVSARTRRCRTHRFPFGILYQIRPDEILITAVMDLRRDPGRWGRFGLILNMRIGLMKTALGIVRGSVPTASHC